MQSYKDVYVGGLYETNNFGILEVVSIDSSVKATVRFVSTGYTAQVELGSIRTGQVKDWSNSMKEFVGKVFPTQNYGDVVILNYEDAHNVKVKFLNTGSEGVFPAGNIKKGKIMDYSFPVSAGIGYLGFGEFNSTKNKGAYRNWIQMIERCYVEHEKFTNYYDKSVTDTWHNFQNFAPWAESQVGFGLKGWQLDKDILIPNNKVYGPDACCYVPARVNSLIIRSDVEGKATDRFGTIYFTVRDAQGKKLNKGFKDRDLGKQWYKEIKEKIVKEVADLYKNELDSRVHAALYSWQVTW